MNFHLSHFPGESKIQIGKEPDVFDLDVLMEGMITNLQLSLSCPLGAGTEWRPGIQTKNRKKCLLLNSLWVIFHAQLHF